VRSRFFYLIIPCFLFILVGFLYLYSKGQTNEFKLQNWLECSEKIKCQPVVLPGSSDRGENNIIYKTSFNRPEFCHVDDCLLVIGEIADSATIYLNKQLIAKHGEVGNKFKYLRHYPFSADLRNLKDENELEIRVYSPQTNQIGLRLDPISVFDKNSGLREKNFIFFKKILLPLFSFFALIIVALLIFIYAIFLNVKQSDLGLKIIFFCLSSSLYMLSITQIPLEVIRIDIATNMHFFLRFLEVFALFVCYQGVLDKKNKYFYIPYYILLALPVFQLVKIFIFENSNITDNYKYTYVLVKNLFVLYLLPHLYALYFFGKSKKWGDFIFVLIYAIMQIWDTLIFHNLVTGQFTLKYNLVIISIYFSIKFFDSEKSIWEKVKSQQALADQATQLAHDIRSPLEVIKSIKGDLMNLPQDAQQRVMMGIGRIEEISRNLLSYYSNAETVPTTLNMVDPLVIIQEVIGQKKIEYPQVIFNFNRAQLSSKPFIEVATTEFKTIISNLINNGIEATKGESAEIQLIALEDSEHFTLKIIDKGHGISKSHIEKLFVKGFTTKKGGHGLGLSHAKENISSWGGDITCTSDFGAGTSFEIMIPKSRSNHSLATRLRLTNIKEVIILDDDQAFHEIWKEKLSNFSGEMKHFFSVDAFLAGVTSIPETTLFLSDLELNHESLSGLDVIKKLNSIDQSVLVTGKGDDRNIQHSCFKLGLRLLPKSMISDLEIIFDVNEIVLIDDDKLIHLLWKNFFKNKNYKLTSYTDFEGFYQNSKLHHKDTWIVVDSKIGDFVRGEVESENVYKLGFKNICLSTGFVPEQVVTDYWIKKVIGKDPNEFIKFTE
jgi:signal transduction histidine kinase/FixJ family two-component response regulator